MVSVKRAKPTTASREVNYAKAADAVAAAADEESEAEDEDTPEEEDDEEEESEEEEEEESEEEESGEEENDVDLNGEGEDDDDDEDEDDEDEEDGDEVSEEETEVKPVQIKPMTSATGEQVTFDLRNLLAFNSHQVNTSALYKTKKSKQVEENITIPLDGLKNVVDEEHLLEKASDGCAQLVSALWQLPTERSDVGPLITLPTYFETRLPRALAPPPPKTETKWEKFAKEKGIGVNQEKRSRKVWDEATQSWMHRTGFERANNNSKEWPIMEVKKNDDPLADPWEKLRDEKKGRVNKNIQNRMKNEERAGNLDKGTTNKTMKSIVKVREEGKKGGNADRDNVVPIGVPIDLKALKGSDAINSLKRGRENTQKALLATQRSTASLGKFDKMREGEPERKKALAGIKKRKFESATDKKVIASESDRGMKLLNAVISGGGAAREKAKRKGHLAKGETAYDYDYEDGLGASSFKKKKGRAGAGKQTKMTKKRIV